MRYFTESWYHAGCRRVEAYDRYYRTIEAQLPCFFRGMPSLHDAIIKRCSVTEPYYGRQDVTIDLDTSQAYAKARQLILRQCEFSPSFSPVGCRWIAEELLLENSSFVLNVLLIAGDRTPLDTWLNAKLTADAPDEHALFDLLWQHLHTQAPDITDRAALERIDRLLQAADLINPKLLAPLDDYSLMDDGIFTAEQLTRALCAYVCEHRLIDLYAELTEETR